ncbi:MAG: hypothetical protein E2P01_11235 [Acidobacteria bacterium]|nr:MAG: hypothetical protein E2P01_11235 [Acidobacteriota bacterium]
MRGWSDPRVETAGRVDPPAISAPFSALLLSAGRRRRRLPPGDG